MLGAPEGGSDHVQEMLPPALHIATSMRENRRMSDYTIKNLKEDVDDAAQQFGLAPDLEARFGRGPLEATNSGVSYQRMAPNFRSAFGHNHKEQEEIYVLVSGSARMKLNDEIVALKPWDAVRIAPPTMRAFEAGPEGAELIAFGAGPARDSELVQGWWTD